MNTPPDESELTARQERAVLALLAEPSVSAAAAAAAAADVPESTLYRWLSDPPFRNRLRSARREVFDRGFDALARSSAEAVEALRRALTCGKPNVEVRAALGILDRVMRVAALADLAAEVEELRAELGQAGREPTGGIE